MRVTMINVVFYSEFSAVGSDGSRIHGFAIVLYELNCREKFRIKDFDYVVKRM